MPENLEVRTPSPDASVPGERWRRMDVIQSRQDKAAEIAPTITGDGALAEQTRRKRLRQLERVRKWRQRKRTASKETGDRTGLFTFMYLARFALRMAADKEPDAQRRNNRRRELMRAWQAYAARIMGKRDR